MRTVLIATTVVLLSAHEVLRAQTPADTLALAKGTAAAVASITSPPQLRADTVIIEATSPWESLVVEELKPRLRDTDTSEDGPYWMKFGTHDLTIVGDSAVVHVEVSICSRQPDWREEGKTRFYGHEFGYFFRREWYGWELNEVLPFSVGDGSCDPSVAPHEHRMLPRLTYVERDVEPVLVNGDEIRSLFDQFYTDSLKREGVGGRVLLWMQIGESGVVTDTKIRTSSGYDILDDAAREIAASMRFTPAENEGDLVSVWIAQPIDFTPSK